MSNHTITDGGSTTELYPVWWRWDLTTPRTLLYSGTKTMPCQITPSQMGVAPPERSPVLWRWNISQTTTTPRTLLYSGAKTKFYQKWDVFVGAANTVMPRRIYLHFALFTTQSRGWGTQLCEKKSEYCQNFIRFLTHKSICLAFIWLLSVQGQMLDISNITKSGEI